MLEYLLTVGFSIYSCRGNLKYVNKQECVIKYLSSNIFHQIRSRVMLKIFPFIYYYARPIIKWMLRKLTRLCELQRICYGSECGASRFKCVERSLELSRIPDIKALTAKLNENVHPNYSIDQFNNKDVPFAVQTVLCVKGIKPNIHPDFPKMFTSCIEAIWGYRRLYESVEVIRATAYNCNDVLHERKLLRLWNLLMPNQPLKQRITKQWQDIGFQV